VKQRLPFFSIQVLAPRNRIEAAAEALCDAVSPWMFWRAVQWLHRPENRLGATQKSRKVGDCGVNYESV
jgi:hypothetical protein